MQKLRLLGRLESYSMSLARGAKRSGVKYDDLGQSTNGANAPIYGQVHVSVLLCLVVGGVSYSMERRFKAKDRALCLLASLSDQLDAVVYAEAYEDSFGRLLIGQGSRCINPQRFMEEAAEADWKSSLPTVAFHDPEPPLPRSGELLKAAQDMQEKAEHKPEPEAERLAREEAALKPSVEAEKPMSIDAPEGCPEEIMEQARAVSRAVPGCHVVVRGPGDSLGGELYGPSLLENILRPNISAFLNAMSPKNGKEPEES